MAQERQLRQSQSKKWKYLQDIWGEGRLELEGPFSYVPLHGQMFGTYIINQHTYKKSGAAKFVNQADMYSWLRDSIHYVSPSGV